MVNRGVAPLDPSTPVGRVRALVRDTEYTALEPAEVGYGAYAIFSDGELVSYLVEADDNIKRAAALAIKGLAIEYVAAERSIRTDDLAVDLRGRGKTLLDVARSFEDDADAEDAAEANDFFQVVPLPAPRHCVRPEGTPRPLPLHPATSTRGDVDGGTP